VFAAHVAGALVIATAVRLSGSRGPLEAVVSALSHTARDGVARRLRPRVQ